jgi:hypothetical protein
VESGDIKESDIKHTAFNCSCSSAGYNQY